MAYKSVRWQHAVKTRTFRWHFGVTLILLILCAFAAPVLFRYIESRQGYRLHDPLLEILPVYDFSRIIFSLLYVLILMGVIILLRSPLRMLYALQAYCILTLLRFTTLLFIPLDPPRQILVLSDPLIDLLFYQQLITKDLFFSGHVGIIALFAFLFQDKPVLKIIYIGGALIIGILVLIQHAHYSIDVIAAPVFAWIAIRIAPISKKFNATTAGDFEEG